MAKLIEITGKALSGEWGNDDETGTGIPVLRTTNFTNDGVINYNNVVTRDIPKKDLSQKYLQPGDIIIEKSGGSDKQPVGRVVYYDGEPSKFLFNNFTGVLRVRDREAWHPRYVFYALYGNYGNGGTKRYENKTTGLHNLKTDQYVQDFAIQEQTLEYQQQVVLKLDKVAEMIALRKEQLARLDQLVKSRFIELFGDYRINEKGFDCKKGSELFKFSSGKFLPEEKRFDEGIPVYGGNGIAWYTSKSLVDYPTIIIGRVGAQCGNIHAVTTPVWITDNAIYIKEQKTDAYTLEFLTELMRMMDFYQYADFSGQPKITQKPLETLNYIMPPIELQNEYTAFVEQTDKSKLAIQQSLDKLETLKKSLMQEYFG